MAERNYTEERARVRSLSEYLYKEFPRVSCIVSTLLTSEVGTYDYIMDHPGKETLVMHFEPMTFEAVVSGKDVKRQQFPDILQALIWLRRHFG